MMDTDFSYKPRSSLAVRELYLSYRLDYGIRESVKRVAQDKKMSRESVCESLGLESRFAKDPE